MTPPAPCGIPGCVALAAPARLVCLVHATWKQGPAGAMCDVCRKPITRGEWYRTLPVELLRSRERRLSKRTGKGQASDVSITPYLHAACDPALKRPTVRRTRPSWETGFGSL